MELYLENLKTASSFDRNTLLGGMERYYSSLSESNFKKKLQCFMKDDFVVRVGRNAYSVSENGQTIYSYEYSDLANEVAEKLIREYSLLDFRIFETIQLNTFVNHQIAHNVIYLSIEGGLGDFIFEELRKEYLGKVLINPSVKVFHQYWQDNMTVIQRLPTEAPKGKKIVWHTELEKMLVDIMADRLVKESVGESEYLANYEQSFHDYVIDESRMFRYARQEKQRLPAGKYGCEAWNVKIENDKNEAGLC